MKKGSKSSPNNGRRPLLITGGKSTKLIAQILINLVSDQIKYYKWI